MSLWEKLNSDSLSDTKKRGKMILSQKQAEFLQMERFTYVNQRSSGVNEKVICDNYVDDDKRLAILRTRRYPADLNMWSGIDSAIEEYERNAPHEVFYCVDEYFLTPANFPMLNEEIYLLLKAVYDKPSN